MYKGVKIGYSKEAPRQTAPKERGNIKWDAPEKRGMEMANGSTTRTKAEWTEIVDAYRASGQTQAAYCRERGISAKALGNHLRQGGAPQKPVTRSNKEWEKMIAGQKSSGLSRAAWCRMKGINADSMLSAERRINAKRKDSLGTGWMELEPVHKGIATGLQHEDSCWGMRIRNGGLEIEVSANYPVEKLAALIEKLVAQC